MSAEEAAIGPIDELDHRPPVLPVSPTTMREPDVVIVVGATEFPESSLFLRSISDYFDAAFRSGMKESQRMRFDFSDRDPDEWELVLSIMRPFSTVPIHKDNFATALAWFDEFGVPAGIRACDRFVVKRLSEYEFCKINIDLSYELTQPAVRELLAYLQACYQCNLNDSKAVCNKLVNKVLVYFPTSIDQDQWIFLCSLLVEYPDCRPLLWGSVAKNLPPHVLDRKPEALLGQDLLPIVLFAEVHRREKDDGVREIVRLCKSFRDRMTPVDDLKRSAWCAKVVERPAGSHKNGDDKRLAWKKLWDD